MVQSLIAKSFIVLVPECRVGDVGVPVIVHHPILDQVVAWNKEWIFLASSPSSCSLLRNTIEFFLNKYMTELGDFRKFLVANYPTKVAQMYGEFGLFYKTSLLSKHCCC